MVKKKKKEVRGKVKTTDNLGVGKRGGGIVTATDNLGSNERSLADMTSHRFAGTRGGDYKPSMKGEMESKEQKVEEPSAKGKDKKEKKVKKPSLKGKTKKKKPRTKLGRTPKGNPQSAINALLGPGTLR